MNDTRHPEFGISASHNCTHCWMNDDDGPDVLKSEIHRFYALLSNHVWMDLNIGVWSTFASPHEVWNLLHALMLIQGQSGQQEPHSSHCVECKWGNFDWFWDLLTVHKKGRLWKLWWNMKQCKFESKFCVKGEKTASNAKEGICMSMCAQNCHHSQLWCFGNRHNQCFHVLVRELKWTNSNWLHQPKRKVARGVQEWSDGAPIVAQLIPKNDHDTQWSAVSIFPKAETSACHLGAISWTMNWRFVKCCVCLNVWLTQPPHNPMLDFSKTWTSALKIDNTQKQKCLNSLLDSSQMHRTQCEKSLWLKIIQSGCSHLRKLSSKFLLEVSQMFHSLIMHSMHYKLNWHLAGLVFLRQQHDHVLW